MADNDGAGDTTPNNGTNESPSPPGGTQAVINYMSGNKIEAAMWLSRLVTILFGISFILPIFGITQYSSGQRVLIAGALTSALRLHQRMPQFALNTQFLAALLSEDSAHYLIYSVIMLYTTQPVSMTLMPVFLFALLHVTKYTKTLLDLLGTGSLQFVRKLIAKVDSNQRMMLRLIATVEVMLMPTTIIMVFLGLAALLLPFIYYRFVCLRYTSIRNPYNREVFAELRQLAEYCSRNQRCPAFAANLIHKIIGFVCRMAPVSQHQQPTNN